MILCRDCFLHFSFDDIFSAIHNFKMSGCSWLLTTTFTGCTKNYDIVTGDWRTLNLELAPFYFPRPGFLLREDCPQNQGFYSDKSLALWSISDLISNLEVSVK